MLGDEPTPGRLYPSWSFANDNNPIIVGYPFYRPRPSPQEERRHLLNEAINEILLQGAEVATGLRLDPVENGRGKDCIEFQEVLLAESLFCLLPHREQAARLEEEVFLFHVLDG